MEKINSITPDQIINDKNMNGNLKSNVTNITCHTAFGPNTNIYVDNHIISMTQMNIAYSNKETTTLGIDNKDWFMKTCRMIAIPEKIYIPYTVNLVLKDGFVIECAPDSLVLTPKGYYPLSALSPGSEVDITRKNIETNKSFLERVQIEKIDKSKSLLGINMPVYLVLSEFENIFIPYILPENPNIVSLINFMQ